jgi:hypothetical protein
MKVIIPTGREPPDEAEKKKILLKINYYNFDKTEHF